MKLSALRNSDVLSFLSLTIFGCFVAAPIFKPGFLYRADHPAHFMQCWYLTTVLLPRYDQIIGWSPYWYCGHPEFQYMPPLGFVLYSLIYYISMGTLDFVSAYKVLIVLCYIVPSICIYSSMRLLGFNPHSSAIAGFFTLSTMGEFLAGGPWSIFIVGTWAFGLSLAFIPLALAVYHKAISEKSAFLTVLSGFIIAVTVLTHPVSGFLVLFSLIFYSLVFLLTHAKSNQRRNVAIRCSKGLVAVLGIAFGLTAFWTVPAMFKIGFIGTVAGEAGSPSTVLTDFMTGWILGRRDVLYLALDTKDVEVGAIKLGNEYVLYSKTLTNNHVILLFSAVGAFFCMKRRKVSDLILFLMVPFAAWLASGSTLYGPLSGLMQAINLRPARAEGVLRVFLLMLAGVGIGEATSLIRKSFYGNQLRKVAALICTILVAATLLGAGFNIFYQSYYGGLTRTSLDYNMEYAHQGIRFEDINQVFEWVKLNVPENTRVAYENLFNLQNNHIFAAAPVFTLREAVGSTYSYWWISADLLNRFISDPYVIRVATPQYMYKVFSDLNVGFIVAYSSGLKSKLSSSQSLFINVENSGVFSIYRLRSYVPTYVKVLDDSQMSAYCTVFEPERIIIHVENASASKTVLIKVCYFPNWRARVRDTGQYVLSAPSKGFYIPFFIAITLPKDGTYDIELTYENTWSDTAGFAITTITFFAIAALTFRIYTGIQRLLRLVGLERVLAQKKRFK